MGPRDLETGAPVERDTMFRTASMTKAIWLDVIAGLKDNLAWFPRYQAYLRDHRPPALIIWGPQDGYMSEASARAYLRICRRVVR